MDDRHRISAYLAAFDGDGARSMCLDEDGVCAMRLFDDLDCSVEVPSAGGVVVFTADLVGMDDGEDVDMLRRAMALNCYGVGTGGNTLGYDAIEGCIVLCRHHAIDGLTSHGFEKRLEAFLSAALTVRDRLRAQEVNDRTGLAGHPPLAALV